MYVTKTTIQQIKDLLEDAESRICMLNSYKDELESLSTKEVAEVYNKTKDTREALFNFAKECIAVHNSRVLKES